MTKENIVESNTQPTQSGERVTQGLQGVRERARRNKQERFTALLHHVSPAMLRESFYALKRKAAPGVDGMTWQEYATGLEDRLRDLHSRVHRGASSSVSRPVPQPGSNADRNRGRVSAATVTARLRSSYQCRANLQGSSDSA